MSNSFRAVLLSLGVVMLVVLLDQSTKTWLAPQFNFIVTLNSVGAWSLPWLGTQVGGWLWGGVIVLFGLSLWALYQLRQFPNQWPMWGLILGGGVSNWLDRWQWQGVRDWLTLPGIGLKNNLADYALTIGIVWLVINWTQSTQVDK